MVMIVSDELKTAHLNAERLLVVNGSLELLSASSAVLAVFTLSATAGTVSGLVWTLAFTGAATGTAAASTGINATTARIKKSDGTVTHTGIDVRVNGSSVGSDESVILLNNTNIAQTQSVTLSTATITHT